VVSRRVDDLLHDEPLQPDERGGGGVGAVGGRTWHVRRTYGEWGARLESRRWAGACCVEA
jgi:hypothetical protein